MTPAFWKALRGHDLTNPGVQRISAMRDRDLQNAMLLDVAPVDALAEYKTSMAAAMELGYDVAQVAPEWTDVLGSRRRRIGSLVQKLPTMLRDRAHATQLLWEAKVHLVSLVAQDAVPAGLTPAHVVALFLYTGDVDIAAHVQQQHVEWSSASPWMPLVALVASGVAALPPWRGECYRKVHVPPPAELWAKGDEISWPTFVNASSDWTQVSDNGQRKGMVFVIQSTAGRHLGCYTRAAQNNPVVFMPGARFRVVSYHKFSAVALVQANIRDTTFAITPGEMARAQAGRRNVIVALEQIE
jgi:hypothetical protein